MSSPIAPREPPAPEAPTARCLGCGRRVPGRPPRCPEHGAVAPGDDPVATPPSDAPPPWFPRYQAIRLVARGGFGEVYRAEPEGGGAAVAIKVARADRPEARARLLAEVETLERVGPPRAPAVYARGELPDGRPFFVMEHLGGATLAARLVAGAPPLGPATAHALSLGVLEALAAVHARGFVHGDLKPENVFVDVGGRATLVDFGLATPIGAAAADGVRPAGRGAGTAEYVAPELWDRRAEGDPRADVYAAGVIVCELFTGRPPFWGPRALVQEAHKSRRPPRLSALAEGRAVPAALEEVVAACLAKDPRRRFADAAALAAALSRISPAAPPSEEEQRPEPAGGGRARPGRLTVGLLFFEAEVDVAAVQQRLRALGGELAHGGGGRFVAIFGHDRPENPARRAALAAHELRREGIAARLRLDVAAVSVQRRRDGSERYVSPELGRGDAYPRVSDPPGLSLSPAAAAVLADDPGWAGGAAEAGPPELAAEPLDGAASDRAPGSAGDLSAAVPLLGRGPLLDALLASARRATAEHLPTVVRVTAAPGHGKSHLFRVLARELGEAWPARVLALTVPDLALGDVDPTLAALLRRALDLPDPTLPGAALPGVAPADAGALLRARLGPEAADELGPAIALALGLRPADAEMASACSALLAAPGALQAALTVAAGDVLRRRAAEGPVYVVIDDIQHGGDVLFAALEYAALAPARAPLWICVLGRPAFAAAHPAWGERAGAREEHELGPLDAESAVALCRHLLLPVESPPDSAVERLVERAQAVPLHLVELVRGLRRMGIVRKSPRGEARYLATDELDRLPDLPLIEWLARGELEALPPALREHARLVALLGRSVTLDEIDGVSARLSLDGDLGERLLDARVGAVRLAEAGLVVVDGEGRVSFRHELVREAIARTTSDDLRRRVHRAAADHHAHAAAAAHDDHRLAQLAVHAAAAGLAEIAVPTYLALADAARARHAYVEAERLYSRALELPGGERVEALRGRGMMRYRSGRSHDAIDDLSRARELAARAGDVVAEVEILLDEATALDWMNDLRRSRERVEAALALAPAERSPALTARLLLGEGRSAMRWSRNEEAVQLLEQAVSAAEPLGDAGYETLVIALPLLGFFHAGQGRTFEARRALDRAVALADRHGDRLQLGAALNLRAMVAANLGDKEAFVEDLEGSIEIARALGQRSLELMGEFNLGEYLLLLDDADAAEPHVLTARALDRKVSGDPGLPQVALLEARLRIHRGDDAGARAIAAAVRAHLGGAGDRPEAVLAPSDDVFCTMIELATRDAADEEWDALEARSEQVSVGQERIEVVETRAVALHRRGRDARPALERALALAASIPNAMAARLERRREELLG